MKKVDRNEKFNNFYVELQRKLDLIYQFKKEKSVLSSLVSNHWVVRANIIKEHFSFKNIDPTQPDFVFYIIEFINFQIADPTITFTIRTKKFESRKEFGGSCKTSYESGFYSLI